MASWLLICLLLPGLWLNWLLSASIIQPDWAAAILLGALLAQRRYALWIIPVAIIHDLMMYWAIWPGMLFWLLAPLFLTWLDGLAGTGWPQRLILVAFMPICWWWLGWSPSASLLTAMMAFFFWYVWAEHPLLVLPFRPQQPLP